MGVTVAVAVLVLPGVPNHHGVVWMGGSHFRGGGVALEVQSGYPQSAGEAARPTAFHGCPGGCHDAASGCYRGLCWGSGNLSAAALPASSLKNDE